MEFLPYRVNHVHVEVTVAEDCATSRDLAQEISHYVELSSYLHHHIRASDVVERFRVLDFSIVGVPRKGTDIQLAPDQVLRCDSVTFTPKNNPDPIPIHACETEVK